jgi:hypothetical protein
MATSSRLTFIYGCNSEANEDVAHYDHNGTKAIVPLKETRLVVLQNTNDDMDQEIDSGSGSI